MFREEVEQFGETAVAGGGFLDAEVEGVDEAFDGGDDARAVALFEDGGEGLGVGFELRGDGAGEEVGGGAGVGGFVLEAEAFEGAFEEDPGAEGFAALQAWRDRVASRESARAG